MQSRRPVLRLAAFALAVSARPRSARAQFYPETCSYRRRLRAGRRDRYYRATACATAVGSAETGICNREPSRCGDQRRDRICRALGARRLHIPDGHGGQCDQRHALWRKAPVQLRHRFRAGCGRGADAECAGSSPVGACALIAGVHRLREGKSRQARDGVRRVGSPGHVSGELLKMMTGIEMLHVPYRGIAPAGDPTRMIENLLSRGGGKRLFLPRRSNKRTPHRLNLSQSARHFPLDREVRHQQGSAGFLRPARRPRRKCPHS